MTFVGASAVSRYLAVRTCEADEGGWPILALFARVGGDDACDI
jgi:hypothetical protein